MERLLMDYSQETPQNVTNTCLAAALVDALKSEWVAREWVIRDKFDELQTSIELGTAFDRQDLLDRMVRIKFLRSAKRLIHRADRIEVISDSSYPPSGGRTVNSRQQANVRVISKDNHNGWRGRRTWRHVSNGAHGKALPWSAERRHDFLINKEHRRQRKQLFT